MKFKTPKKFWVFLFLILTALEGFIAAGIVFQRRSGTQGYFLNTGLTLKNLLLLGSALGVAVFLIFLLVQIQRKPEILLRFHQLLTRRGWVGVIGLFLLILLVGSSQDIIYLYSNLPGNRIVFEYYSQLLHSLLPFLVWIILFSVQALLLLRTQVPLEQAEVRKAGVSPVLLLFLNLFLIWFGFGFANLGFFLGRADSGILNQFPELLTVRTLLVVVQGVMIFFTLSMFRRIGAPGRKMKTERRPTRILWITAGFLVLVLALMLVWGGGLLSLEKVHGKKETTNAPLSIQQIFFLWLGITAGWYGLNSIKKRWPKAGVVLESRWLLLVGFWLVAFWIWSSIPIAENYFTGGPRAPNFQNFPLSDAVHYETQAHRFMAGEGFVKGVNHPFFPYLLSGFHAIAGDHYLDVYPIQMGLLAFAPYFLYQLTRKLHHEYAGWLIAGLFILRERNSLWLGDTITVSNSQVLMTETLTQLGVILILYLAVTFFMDGGKSWGKAVLLGTLMGALLMLRIEYISLLIITGLYLVWLVTTQKKAGLRSSILLLAAVGLMVAPWMIRNYQVTGNFYIDKGGMIRKYLGIFLDRSAAVPARNNYLQTDLPDPRENNNYLAFGDFPQTSDRAWPESGWGFAVMPREAAPKNASLPIAHQETSAASLPIERQVQIRGDALARIWTPFRRSLAESILYLPSNHMPLYGSHRLLKNIPVTGRVGTSQGAPAVDDQLTIYVKSLPYWQYDWNGVLDARSWIPVTLVLLVIAAGLWKSWSENHLITLFPLLIWLLQLLIYAFFAFSGGRYIQAVDWILLIYLSIGMGWCTASAEKRFLKSEEPGSRQLFYGLVDSKDHQQKENPSWRNWLHLSLSVALLASGILLPILEASLPKRYTEEALAQRIDDIQDHGYQDLDGLIDLSGDLLADDRYTLVYGKLLYPAFYWAEESVSDIRQGRVPVADEPMLIYYIVGTKNIWGSLPMVEAPEFFPHGVDAVLVGERTRNEQSGPYFEARSVYLFPGKEQEPKILRIDCTLDRCRQ